MADIVGMEGIRSTEHLEQKIAAGAKFVIYRYCISLLVVTLMNLSSIHFIPAGQSRLTKGIKFTLLSLILGWWGLPWGPIRTIQVLATNFGGGKDVTHEVLASMKRAR